MTKNLDQNGFRSIVNNYDLFFIDIWGVIHNGINLFDEAVNTLENLKKLNKEYVLLTNAPRPNFSVVNFLKKMGLDEKHCSRVYASGQAALMFLKKKYKNNKFFHIGPPRDFDLFLSFKENKVNNLNNCEFILCTGLFDENMDNLDYYKDLLKHKINLKMICTNPDLVVDKGNRTEFCAGTVAKIFEDLGGEVDYFGKPYPLIYELSAELKNKKVLCIGDNINTDIKGANNQNFSSLFISSGIHKNEKHLKDFFNNYKVKVNYMQSYLKW